MEQIIRYQEFYSKWASPLDAMTFAGMSLFNSLSNRFTGAIDLTSHVVENEKGFTFIPSKTYRSSLLRTCALITSIALSILSLPFLVITRQGRSFLSKNSRENFVSTLGKAATYALFKLKKEYDHELPRSNDIENPPIVESPPSKTMAKDIQKIETPLFTPLDKKTVLPDKKQTSETPPPPQTEPQQQSFSISDLSSSFEDKNSSSFNWPSVAKTLFLGTAFIGKCVETYFFNETIIQNPLIDEEAFSNHSNSTPEEFSFYSKEVNDSTQLFDQSITDLDLYRPIEWVKNNISDFCPNPFQYVNDNTTSLANGIHSTFQEELSSETGQIDLYRPIEWVKTNASDFFSSSFQYVNETSSVINEFCPLPQTEVETETSSFITPILATIFVVGAAALGGFLYRSLSSRRKEEVYENIEPSIQNIVAEEQNSSNSMEDSNLSDDLFSSAISVQNDEDQLDSRSFDQIDSPLFEQTVKNWGFEDIKQIKTKAKNGIKFLSNLYQDKPVDVTKKKEQLEEACWGLMGHIIEKGEGFDEGMIHLFDPEHRLFKYFLPVLYKRGSTHYKNRIIPIQSDENLDIGTDPYKIGWGNFGCDYEKNKLPANQRTVVMGRIKPIANDENSEQIYLKMENHGSNTNLLSDLEAWKNIDQLIGHTGGLIQSVGNTLFPGFIPQVGEGKTNRKERIPLDIEQRFKDIFGSIINHFGNSSFSKNSQYQYIKDEGIGGNLQKLKILKDMGQIKEQAIIQKIDELFKEISEDCGEERIFQRNGREVFVDPNELFSSLEESTN